MSRFYTFTWFCKGVISIVKYGKMEIDGKITRSARLVGVDNI